MHDSSRSAAFILQGVLLLTDSRKGLAQDQRQSIASLIDDLGGVDDAFELAAAKEWADELRRAL